MTKTRYGSLTDEERIDEAGMESFPASDPPSWTSGIERHLESPAATDGAQVRLGILQRLPEQ